MYNRKYVICTTLIILLDIQRLRIRQGLRIIGLTMVSEINSILYKNLLPIHVKAVAFEGGWVTVAPTRILYN